MVNWSQRLIGVQAALARAGLTMQEKDRRNPVGEGIAAIQIATYETAARQWLAEGDLPEAIIFPTCMLAAVFQRVMLEQGLRCPEDLSMVCFDDDVFVSMCTTAPTRLATFPVDIGRKAMDRLLYLLRHPNVKSSPQKTVIPMSVIEGKSVAATAPRPRVQPASLPSHDNVQADPDRSGLD